MYYYLFPNFLLDSWMSCWGDLVKLESVVVGVAITVLICLLNSNPQPPPLLRSLYGYVGM